MIDVIASRAMPHPYPEQPDDGTWEGEGGYVAKPDHQMWRLSGMVNPITGYQERVKLVMHPTTYGEYMYWFDKSAGFVSYEGM